MSTSLFDSPVGASTAAPATNTFDYQPVPIMAPVSLFLGITSLFAFITVGGLPIALIGLAVSAWFLLKIIRSKGEIGGRSLALGGLGLSALSLVCGTVLQSVAYATEVPEGFTRLNFTENISAKGFVVENGVQTYHPDVVALNEQKIFLKGYMYPTRRTKNFTSFVFCRDSGDCCFGGTPKIEDMIVVNMADGQKVDYINGLVSVAGTFHLRSDFSSAEYASLTGAEPIYEMTGTRVEASRSSF